VSRRFAANGRAACQYQRTLADRSVAMHQLPLHPGQV